MAYYTLQLTEADFKELVGLITDKITECEEEIEAAQTEDDGDEGGNVDPDTTEALEYLERISQALTAATVKTTEQP
jgi:hypothetical protein